VCTRTGTQAFCLPFAQLTARIKDIRAPFQTIYTNTNMTFLLEHFNSVKCVILLFVVISVCNASIQSVTTSFITKKRVATSHTTLQKISKIHCVERCNREIQNGRCTLAGYHKANKTCDLSVDDPQNVSNTTDEISVSLRTETQWYNEHVNHL